MSGCRGAGLPALLPLVDYKLLFPQQLWRGMSLSRIL